MFQETLPVPAESTPFVLPQDRLLTLSELMDLWGRAAAGEQIPMTESELIKLVEMKADDYRMAHDFAESEAAQFKGYAAEMTDRASQAQSRADRIKAFLAIQMAEMGLTKISGRLFTARVQLYESTQVDFDKPSAEDAMRFPLLVKPKFEWSKTSIKEAIEAGETFSFARQVKTPKVVFGTIPSAKGEGK